MLQQLRENTKTILWIVVVTFVVSIFAVWGMNLKSRSDTPQTAEDIVGSVNGEKISRRMYALSYEQMYNRIKMQRGEDFQLSATESFMLAEQAWESLVAETLRRQEIEKIGITVTDNELVSFIRQNPPQEVQQYFVNEEGQFDYQAYLRELSNTQRDWRWLEQWGLQQLPVYKLETLIVSQIHVSDRAILERFEKQNVAVQAQYVMVPFVDEQPPYEPGEEEIRALYDETKDEFTEFEKRAVRLIKIERSATDLDEREVKEQIDEIRTELKEGADFAETAKIHSDDLNSATNGGDLGFFGRGTMDSIFTEVAFSLEPGEISDPVRTEFGYHIIRTEEKKTEDGEEKVRASHILMKVEPGYETIDSLSTLLEDLSEAIKTKGFEDGAASMGLEPYDVEPFFKGAFIKDEGYLPRLVNFAFTHDVGSISSPMGTENAFYYVKVTKIIPEKTRSLEEVSAQLADRIRYDRKIERSKSLAESIRQEALTSGDLEAVAHSRELEMKETAPFKVDDAVAGIGSGTGFAVACHELPLNKISVPIKGQNGWFIIKVISRTSPDMTEFGKQRQTIRDELMQEYAYDYLTEWYQQLRENAEIVDNRERTLD